MSDSARGRSSRAIFVGLALVVIVGVLAYLAYWKGWFARDSEDRAEIEKVREKPLGLAPAADTAVGSPRWRGPTGDGRAAAGPFRADWDKSPPKLLWQAECGGGYSSCAVVGGKVFTQDYRAGKERVICLDGSVTPAKLVWEHAYDVDFSKIRGGYAVGPRATPTVEGNRVYAVGAVGKVLCLDSATGKPLWERELTAEFEAQVPQWGFAGSPLIEGDLVVVQPGGRKGAVAAYDKNTGERSWAAGANAAGYSSPVVATTAGRRVIYALTGDALLAVGTDGTVHDRYEWKTSNEGNIATPLVVDDYVFISSAYQQGSALLRVESRGSGVRFVQVYARRGRAYQNHHSTSVYRDHKLYGFDGMTSGARLKCVDFDTGLEKEEWDAAGIPPGSGSLILAGNHLIIQSERGDLCLVEATPEEFRLVAKLPKVLSGNSNWATPTLVEGRLYLRDEQKVVCYDVRP